MDVHTRFLAPVSPRVVVAGDFCRLLSLARKHGEHETPTELRDMVSRLHELGEEHPEESGLLESYAQVVSMVIQNADSYGLAPRDSLRMIDRLARRARRLAAGSPAYEATLLWLGVSKFSVVTSLAGRYPFALLLELLADAEQFLANYPHKEQFTFFYLTALASVIQSNHVFEDIAQLEKLLERLGKLTACFAECRDMEHSWMRESYAWALASMILRYRKLS